jgi:hypothetical protein
MLFILKHLEIVGPSLSETLVVVSPVVSELMFGKSISIELVTVTVDVSKVLFGCTPNVT